MRVTALPGTPEITYITGLGMVLCGDGDGTDEAPRHTVEIIVDDPHNLGSKCPDGEDALCPAGGADGDDRRRRRLGPGEYHTGDGVTVAAVNLPGECRPFGFEKYWLDKQEEADETSTARGRNLREAVPTSQWLLRDSHRTDPAECARYVNEAAEAGSLFEHRSDHVSFQVASPLLSLRVNHGKIYQLAMRDPTDTVDLPEHVAFQMNVGFEKMVLGDDPQGVIGETVHLVLDEAGQPVMQGLGAIRGGEEDYRVECLLYSELGQLHVE